MMENLKDALEYLVGLGEEQDIPVVEINGSMYTRESIRRIDDEVRIETLNLKTLTGLVDYIRETKETFEENRCYLVVEDPTKVVLRRQLNSDGNMLKVAEVEARPPMISTGNYYVTEEFNILLQSAFVQNEDRDILLKVVGNIKEEVIKSVGDDGISQAATIKTGVATMGDVIIPNPVSLIPRRTFNEVEQPESQFIFRMKDGPRCALFEADGGAWKNEAMQNIKNYLKTALDGIDGLIIIS